MSSDVKSALDDYLKVLDEFASKIHINKFKADPKLDEILESDESTRSLWSEEDLINKAFTLYNYSGYLQRVINQNDIKKRWANHNLSVMYGKVSQGYGNGYSSYKERQDMALADNAVIKVLCEILLAAETRISQLYDLNRHISNLANNLTEMAKTKRSHRYDKNSN